MSKGTIKKAYAAPADYVALVKRFAIRPLSSRGEYEAACAMIEPMVGRGNLTRGAEAIV